MKIPRKIIQPFTSSFVSHADIGGGGVIRTNTVTVTYPSSGGQKALYAVVVWTFKAPTGGISGIHTNVMEIANYNPQTGSVGNFAAYGSSTFKYGGVVSGNPTTGATGTPFGTGTASNNIGFSVLSITQLPLCSIDTFTITSPPTTAMLTRGVSFYAQDGDQFRFAMVTNSAGGGGPGARYYYEIYYFF